MKLSFGIVFLILCQVQVFSQRTYYIPDDSEKPPGYGDAIDFSYSTEGLKPGLRCYTSGKILYKTGDYCLIEDGQGGWIVKAFSSPLPSFSLGEQVRVWGQILRRENGARYFDKENPNRKIECQVISIEYYYGPDAGSNFQSGTVAENGSADSSSESKTEIAIIDSAGNAKGIPNSHDPGIISNMADAMAFLGIQWTSLDYQAAMFSEYKDIDRIVLQGTVQQVQKNPKGGFVYFVFLSGWSSAYHGNLTDEAAIYTNERVKGLDVDKNGIFYCTYSSTLKFDMVSKLTGVKSKVEMPTFKAIFYGLNLR